MPNREQRRRAKKDGNSEIIKITLDGHTYEIDLLEFSALDEADLEAKTGISIMGFGEVMTDRSKLRLAHIAGMLWISRRHNEPELEYEDVARTITMRDLMALAEGDADEAPSPE